MLVVAHTLSVNGGVHSAAAHQVDATARKHFLRDSRNDESRVLGHRYGEIHMNLVANEDAVGVEHRLGLEILCGQMRANA